MIPLPLRTRWQALTDTGLVRGANEDAHCASDALGLWAVADGMGGLARGDRAAATVIEALGVMPRIEPLDAALEGAAVAIRAANASIYMESRSRGAQMGTTVVALLIRERRFGLIWVGDSRAYRLRDGALERISHDHSQVQALVDRGLIGPEEAADHPMRHILSRAVGVQETVELDAATGDVQPDDIFLLCSDGLHGVVADPEIAALLVGEEDAAGALVARCLERGAPDNVTVITIVATEPTIVMVGRTLESTRP